MDSPTAIAQGIHATDGKSAHDEEKIRLKQRADEKRSKKGNRKASPLKEDFSKRQGYDIIQVALGVTR